MRPRFNIILGSLLVAALALSACGGGGNQAPDQTDTGLGEENQAALVPQIQVKDQDAGGGVVTIEKLIAVEPSWVVIHTKSEGAPGPVIGYTLVEGGESTDVQVEIDLTQATSDLYAMLHIDAGTAGDYEFPGDDVPVKVGDAIVNVPFSVTLPELEPSVSVSEQEAGAGQVTIDEVIAGVPGWIVIHTTANGKPGPVIGYAPVEAGRNQAVVVDIDAEQATPQLFAMLHINAGAAGEYEFPGDDIPVKVGDTIVNVPFVVTLPDYTPSLSVIDQETSGIVIIEEVRPAQAGWLVIHVENDGAPGPIIGYAPVSVGINTALEIEIDLAQATDKLFAMLHIDAGTLGEYEFPGDDLPVKVGDAVLVVPFTITKAESSAADSVAVAIQGSAFSEQTLSIPAGTTVVWSNGDQLPHTVKADDGSFDSGTLDTGDTFQYTFNQTGTFAYYCAFHGGPDGVGMSAIITVTES